MTQRDIMLFEYKNQYCQNDNTTQSNTQMQRNPYQINNSIFHRIKPKLLQYV